MNRDLYGEALPFSDACFSPCRTYRYSLTRTWGGAYTLPPLVAIGLNPSTADEKENDPTITREIDFAQRWGHSGLLKVNLFAYRSTDPDALWKDPEFYPGRPKGAVCPGCAGRGGFDFKGKCPRCDGKGTVDPVGPENDTTIKSAVVGRCVLVGWGTHRKADLCKLIRERGEKILELVKPFATRVVCLGQNKDGSPKHPLYLKATTGPQTVWERTVIS